MPQKSPEAEVTARITTPVQSEPERPWAGVMISTSEGQNPGQDLEGPGKLILGHPPVSTARAPRCPTGRLYLRQALPGRHKDEAGGWSSGAAKMPSPGPTLFFQKVSLPVLKRRNLEPAPPQPPGNLRPPRVLQAGSGDGRCPWDSNQDT